MEKFKTYFLYLTVFITGAVVLIIEILGTRIIAPFYGSTIFVWSALIATALGFLSLGYWLGGRLADKKPFFTYLYLIIFLSGAAIAGSIQFKKSIILFADGFGLKYGPLAASILLFGLAFFFFGMVTPYAIRLRTHLVEKVGTRSGSIFAFSTVGSLLGALLAGFVLIPIFPLTQIFYGLAGLSALLAIVGFLIFFGEGGKFPREAVMMTLAFTIIIFGAGYFFKYSDRQELTFQEHAVFVSETLFEENNFYGENQLIGQPRLLDGKICFLIDRTNQGCISRHDEHAHDYIPAVAIASTYEEGSRFLMFGLGLGEYFYFYPPENFQTVEVVDINPAAFAAAEASSKILREDFHDPRADYTNYIAHTEDARAFLQNTDDKYDFIFTDLLSNVVFPEYMFTKESFSLARNVITDDGSFVMSVVGKTNGEDEVVNSVIATVRSVFPYIYLYSEHPDHFFEYNLVVARKEPMDVEDVNRRILEIAEGEEMEGFQSLEDRENEGAIIIDDFNPLPNLWAGNLARYTESVTDLRRKFKRLTRADFN